MLRQFHKMHGLGNDFVILDAREQPLEMTEALARHLADRREGIGCDQLILLHQGRIVAHGAPDTVLTPDLLREVYQVDATVLPHPETGCPMVAYNQPL